MMSFATRLETQGMDGNPVCGDAALWGIRFLQGREPRDLAEIEALLALPNVGLMRAQLLRDGEPVAFDFAAPLDASTVTWAFLMILGRPPESAEIVAQHQRLGTATDLAACLYASPEFGVHRGPWMRFDLCGRLRRFVGHHGDPYHKTLERHAIEAAQIARLAAAVGRARGRLPEIIDIGANLGLTVAALAPQASRILAVEPNPVTAGYLEFNNGLNRLDNVWIARTALGDAQGEVRFIPSPFSAGSHIANDTFNTSAIAVPMTTLDTLVSEYGFEDIGFIKLDVEGFERQVLDGAAETIARHRPVIFMEFNTWTLIAMGDTQPIRFLRALVEGFPHVHAIEDAHLQHFESHGFRRLAVHDLASVLYRNMFGRGSCENLVLSHDLHWLDCLG
jgi:FkbM family methyltransferase